MQFLSRWHFWWRLHYSNNNKESVISRFLTNDQEIQKNLTSLTGEERWEICWTLMQKGKFLASMLLQCPANCKLYTAETSPLRHNHHLGDTRKKSWHSRNLTPQTPRYKHSCPSWVNAKTFSHAKIFLTWLFPRYGCDKYPNPCQEFSVSIVRRRTKFRVAQKISSRLRGETCVIIDTTYLWNDGLIQWFL